jgi:hypothetical protein
VFPVPLVTSAVTVHTVSLVAVLLKITTAEGLLTLERENPPPMTFLPPVQVAVAVFGSSSSRVAVPAIRK